MGPGEIIISGGVSMIAIKELVGLVKHFAPKTQQITERDMKQAQSWDRMQATLEKTNDILAILVDKQNETKDQVKDIFNVQSQSFDSQKKTHDRINLVQSHLDVLSQVITKDTIKDIVKGAFPKDICKA